MIWRHRCTKTSGWSAFEFESCDGCIIAALTTEAYSVEDAAAIRTTLRATQRLPSEKEERLPADPVDLAHVKELYRRGQSSLLSWSHEALQEIAEALKLDVKSDKMKRVDKVLRRAIAKALIV